MTVHLTDELRDAIANSQDLTVRLYDSQNEVAYVVIPEAIYERLCTASDDHLVNESQYAHVAKLLGPNGLDWGEEDTVV